MTKVTFLVILMIAVLDVGYVGAVGPGEGEMTKQNVFVGNGCLADSLTVRWDLGSLLGEPTVSGSYKYHGSCQPAPGFMIWLRVEYDGGGGYVRLDPAIPSGPGEWGFNVTGVPDWDEVLCGFDGIQRTECHSASAAKEIWTNGRVTDFAVPWQAPSSGTRVSGDNFSASVVIGGMSGRGKGSNIGAGKESGEPDHADESGGASVWWTWTAPTTGPVTFDTRGSNFDTLLAVYTGDSLSDLTETTSNDDTGGTRQSAVRFSAQRGQTYRIAVDGWDGESGTVVLNWRAFSAAAVLEVATDNFAPSVSIIGASGRSTGGNVGAGKESDEPDHAGDSGGASVWWTWAAPTTGPVTFDTRGSNFDTLLAVYTGGSLNDLTAIASNDDTDDWLLQSEVRFSAQQGQTYHIAVDGYGGATGTIILNWQEGPGPDATLHVFDLEISVFGEGALRIASGGEQLDCAAITICQGVFEMGNEVVIEASPDSGWAHERWIGCDQGSGNRCTVFVDGNRFVSVAFRTTEPPEVEDHVIHLQADQRQDLVEYDVANGVLVFESDTAGLSQWAIGGILLSGGDSTRSDDRSMPFARRILDIVEAPDSRTHVHTIQASLDDIFRSGSLSYRGQGEVVTASASPPGSVVVAQSGDSSFPNEVAVDLTFHDANGQEVITVTGTLGLLIEPEFDISFGPLEARFVAHARTTGSLSLNLDSAGSLFSAEKILPLRIRLASLTVFAGPVPVVITPVGELYLTVRVDVSNPTKPTVTYNISTTVGAHYKSGHGTKPVFSVDVDPGFELTDPDYDLVLTAETGVRGKLQLKIYETLGPHVDFGPFMGVRTECAWSHADIYAGARLGVGGEAEILGYGMRWEIPAWERQWNIRRINLRPDADESVGLVTSLRVTDPEIDRLTLNWNAPRNDCGVAGYNIYRDGWLIEEGIAKTSFVDGGLVPGREYCYQVSAAGSSGEETTPSAEVCGSTEELETDVPEPPVNVAAEALSSSMILVTWDTPAGADDVSGYVVYQHSGPDVFAIDSVVEAIPEVEVGGLQPDSEYCFSVGAVSTAGFSDRSSMVCVLTLESTPNLSDPHWFCHCPGYPDTILPKWVSDNSDPNSGRLYSLLCRCGASISNPSRCDYSWTGVAPHYLEFETSFGDTCDPSYPTIRTSCESISRYRHDGQDTVLRGCVFRYQSGEAGCSFEQGGICQAPPGL